MGKDKRNMGTDVFEKETSRPMDVSLDGVVVLIYDGRKDTLLTSMRGHPNRLEYMIASYIADHVDVLNADVGGDVTADALRNIFEMAKHMMRKNDGNN